MRHTIKRLFFIFIAFLVTHGGASGGARDLRGDGGD